MGREKVIKILMRRDDMEREEAEELVEDVMNEVQDAIAVGDYDLAEDLFMGDLGLEPDYLMGMFL